MKSWIIAASLAVAATADASPLADALAKADVKALSKTDPAARCVLGAVYAKKGDLTRAHFFLTGCSDVTLPEDVSPQIAKVTKELKKKLDDGDYSMINIETKPDALSAEISALPGETFTTSATIWVKAGTYDIKVQNGGMTFSQAVTVDKRSRALALIDTGATHKLDKPPKDTTVSFEQEAAAEVTQKGPPPPVQRKSLVPDKYNKKQPAPGTQLEDPLATRHAGPSESRMLWLGFRLGAGMFDDGATTARAGAALGAVARYRFAESPWFLAGRLDWSRRGGEAPDALDVVGASAGAGVTLASGSIGPQTHHGGVALIGQLRADMRIQDDRAMSSVNRFGASAAVNLELTLPSTPITAGLRVEQGLTEIVNGARDRAVLLEVGVDWR